MRRRIANRAARLGLGWRGLAAVGTAAALVLGLAAFGILRSQATARDQLLERFDSRAPVGAQFTGSVVEQSAMGGENRAVKFLSGARPTVSELRTFAYDPEPGKAHSILADAHGRILAAIPARLARGDARTRFPELLRAVHTKSPVMGAAYPRGPGMAMEWAIPFRTERGWRVVTLPIGVAGLNSFMERFLPDLPLTANSSAYLLDPNGIIVGNGSGDRAGVPLGNSVLAAAVRRSDEGTYFSHGVQMHFIAAPVPSSAGYRLVLAAPQSAIFAPLADTRRLAYLLLAGLALVVVAGLYILLRGQARSRELAVARERLRDARTGLPSGSVLVENLAADLEAARANGGGVGIVALDIDRFKRINDALGQEAGDQALVQVAERLVAEARSGETVARLGGDEFAVVLHGAVDEAAAAERVRAIREALGRPMQIDGHRICLAASVGLALDDGETRADVLFDGAEAALTQARLAEEPYVVSHPAVRARALDLMDLEDDLREAIENNDIVPHYQPIVSLGDGHVLAVEALARWRHPSRGFVPPDVFIRVAEESDLILRLGEQMLEKACDQLVGWHRAGHRLELHVNLSMRQLGSEDIVETVAGVLERSGFEAEMLCLELTETSMMLHSEVAIRRVHELKALGVRIAIDDFGVGYSSLSQIARLLPVDAIKIDRSFVDTPPEGPEASIVGFVVNLCNSLGLVSIAEGVETADQAARVALDGCRLAQGYHFARPQPPAEIERMLDALLPVA